MSEPLFIAPKGTKIGGVLEHKVYANRAEREAAMENILCTLTMLKSSSGVSIAVPHLDEILNIYAQAEADK